MGGFKNGEFHGKGALHIPGLGTYNAVWEFGEVHTKQYLMLLGCLGVSDGCVSLHLFILVHTLVLIIVSV